MNPTQQPEQPVPQLNQSGGTGNTKKTLTVIGVIALLIAAGAAIWWYVQNQAATPDQQEESSVSITTEGFSPNTIKIKPGQEVTWSNDSSDARELKADTESLPEFGGAESLAAGDSYTYIFDEAGTYNYYDATSPDTHSGTVIVE